LRRERYIHVDYRGFRRPNYRERVREREKGRIGGGKVGLRTPSEHREITVCDPPEGERAAAEDEIGGFRCGKDDLSAAARLDPLEDPPGAVGIEFGEDVVQEDQGVGAD